MSYVIPINRPVSRRWVIGIDPDLKKNGFAVYDRLTRKVVQLETLTFYRLVRMMQKNFADVDCCEVVIEGGWLHKGLYKRHGNINVPDRIKDNPVASANYIAGVRERKSKNVGENHAVGKLLVEYLKEEGYEVTVKRPDKAKWTADDMKLFTGIDTKDPEKIDAASQCFAR